jgi:hypothetical protein
MEGAALQYKYSIVSCTVAPEKVIISHWVHRSRTASSVAGALPRCTPSLRSLQGLTRPADDLMKILCQTS